MTTECIPTQGILNNSHGSRIGRDGSSVRCKLSVAGCLMRTVCISICPTHFRLQSPAHHLGRLQGVWLCVAMPLRLGVAYKCLEVGELALVWQGRRATMGCQRAQHATPRAVGQWACSSQHAPSYACRMLGFLNTSIAVPTPVVAKLPAGAVNNDLSVLRGFWPIYEQIRMLLQETTNRRICRHRRRSFCQSCICQLAID